VTRPLARASSCETSRLSHSTRLDILASARPNSSRAVGSVIVCCEPGVKDSVVMGARAARFDEEEACVCSVDSVSSVLLLLTFF
jgi:hypothetical protein